MSSIDHTAGHETECAIWIPGGECSCPRGAFGRIAEREMAAANAKADRDDERMAAAARGEPFFTNVATGPIVGLNEYTMSPGTWRLPEGVQPTAHESDCAIFGKSDGMDNRTVLVECTCPMGNL